MVVILQLLNTLQELIFSVATLQELYCPTASVTKLDTFSFQTEIMLPMLKKSTKVVKLWAQSWTKEIRNIHY